MIVMTTSGGCHFDSIQYLESIEQSQWPFIGGQISWYIIMLSMVEPTKQAPYHLVKAL